MANGNRQCLECGRPFQPRQNSALFCGDPCRTSFHHRRRARGAELYDFLMNAYVTGRQSGKDDMIRKLVDAYIAADKKFRAGRASFQPIQYATANIPMAYSDEGDKR